MHPTSVLKLEESSPPRGRMKNAPNLHFEIRRKQPSTWQDEECTPPPRGGELFRDWYKNATLHQVAMKNALHLHFCILKSEDCSSPPPRGRMKKVYPPPF